MVLDRRVSAPSAANTQRDGARGYRPPIQLLEVAQGHKMVYHTTRIVHCYSQHHDKHAPPESGNPGSSIDWVKWKSLDILEQKRLLEETTGLSCPLTDQELVDAQKAGWHFRGTGLLLYENSKAFLHEHKRSSEQPKEKGPRQPSVADILFELEGDKEDPGYRVELGFDPSGKLRVNDLRDQYRSQFGVLSSRKPLPGDVTPDA